MREEREGEGGREEEREEEREREIEQSGMNSKAFSGAVTTKLSTATTSNVCDFYSKIVCVNTSQIKNNNLL